MPNGVIVNIGFAHRLRYASLRALDSVHIVVEDRERGLSKDKPSRVVATTGLEPVASAM